MKQFEKRLLDRVAALPPKVQKIVLDDLAETFEARVATFERIFHVAS